MTPRERERQRLNRVGIDLTAMDLGELSTTRTAAQWLLDMAGKHGIVGPDVISELDALIPEIAAELDRKRMAIADDQRREREHAASRWSESDA